MLAHEKSSKGARPSAEVMRLRVEKILGRRNLFVCTLAKVGLLAKFCTLFLHTAFILWNVCTERPEREKVRLLSVIGQEDDEFVGATSGAEFQK